LPRHTQTDPRTVADQLILLCVTERSVTSILCLFSMPPCSVVGAYQLFRGTCSVCLHENGSSKSIRNLCISLQDYTVSQHRRSQSEQSPTSEPQNKKKTSYLFQKLFFSTLKMEAACSSETLVSVNHTIWHIWHHTLEDSDLHNYCGENSPRRFV
jgi:hypothetical protein